MRTRSSGITQRKLRVPMAFLCTIWSSVCVQTLLTHLWADFTIAQVTQYTHCAHVYKVSDTHACENGELESDSGEDAPSTLFFPC